MAVRKKTIEKLVGEKYSFTDTVLDEGDEIPYCGIEGIIMRAPDSEERADFIFAHGRYNPYHDSPCGYFLLDTSKIRKLDKRNNVIDLVWPFGGVSYFDATTNDGFGKIVYDTVVSHGISVEKIENDQS